MLTRSVRELWKQALWWARIKLVYTRITLTPFTTLYFFFALINCLVLVILQGISYTDNIRAVNVVEGLSGGARMENGLLVISGDELRICNGIPGQLDATCDIVASSDYNANTTALELREVSLEVLHAPTDFLRYSDDSIASRVSKRSLDPHFKFKAVPAVEDSDITKDGILDEGCISTLIWLDDVLHDAKREDVVTLLFHLWLFSLAVVTILNESLPHLGASLAGHILGTTWGAYRIKSSEKLRLKYVGLISNGACRGIDHLGGWWEVRKLHMIPVVIVSVLAFFAMAYLSINLFKVYASQSFSRVGASPQIHKIYKTVLVLSASLQLTGFFSLASTAMWIDRISHGVVRSIAQHIKIYLAAFIVTLLLEVPWLVLGWISVRKEHRRLFLIFSSMSVFLVVISTLMFISPLYRFIFMSWPFFATITVTAYTLIITSSFLGIWCRLHFGKGLAHFLQVKETLEGADFTPVCFFLDAEKANLEDSLLSDKKKVYNEDMSSIIVHGYSQQPEYPSPSKARGQSVYSESAGTPIIMSITPPLFQGGTLAASTGGSTTIHQDEGFGKNELSLSGGGKSTRLQMPPKSASGFRTRSSELASLPLGSSLIHSVTLPPKILRPGLPAHPKRRPMDI